MVVSPSPGSRDDDAALAAIRHAFLVVCIQHLGASGAAAASKQLITELDGIQH